MIKGVKLGAEARNVLIQGVDEPVNAVRVTTGSKDRNVVLGKPYDAPLVTNDDVTITKEIELEDVFANMGAQLVKEVATKTNDVVGDGTTTAIVLARAMINEGAKNIATGFNPIVFRKGMKKVCDKVVETIKEMFQPISGKKQITGVAAISASNDEVSEIVVDAMEKVTNNGVIIIEESKTMKTELDLVEGMQFDRGYILAYMVNDVEKMEATFEDPYIPITDKKISSIQEVLLLPEEIAKSDAKLPVTAEDVEGGAFTTLIVNRLCGIFNVVAVKAPGYGDRRKEMLQDIAVLTGGIVINEQLGPELKDARMAQLGRAKSVKVTKKDTVIMDGLDKKADIDAGTTQIRAQLAETSSEFDKEKLRERLARLSGNVVAIRVGAATGTKMKEAKLRMEDVLNAARAAVEEGTVAGGGTVYINASKKVWKLIDNLEGDEKIGVKIVMKVLGVPLFYTTGNASLEGTVIMNQVKGSKKGIGSDAYNEAYADMAKEGVLDPTEATKTVLENATSVASTLLTTEPTIATIKKPQAAPAMPVGGMDGMM